MSNVSGQRGTERVIVYIDGFNLYYGLRSMGWRHYLWLDLRQLSENLLRPPQRLEMIRYFTARISAESHDPDRPRRQGLYLEALGTLLDLSLHYGSYITKNQRCPNCGAITRTFEEKMTDVNIAVEMLCDAQDNAFDTAIVISADGDLTGPISAVRRRYPQKRVVIAFPPGRRSFALRSAANGYFNIGQNAIRNSQLPEHVVKPDGYILKRPPSWA